MRIADDPPFHAPVPAGRRPLPVVRVEPVETLPALPRHRSLTIDRKGRERSRYEPGNLPPRGWLIDIFV